MTRRSIAVALVSLCGVAFAARTSPLVAAPRAAPEYRITDLRAQLFYSDRGTFSDNLLARAKLDLWNTIIGAGDAGGPSTETLIVVEISGEPNSYPSTQRVEIVVSNDRKEILRRQLSLGVLGKDGHAYAAVWLYDTGCRPLKISVALLGQLDASRRVATIPFECGE